MTLAHQDVVIASKTLLNGLLWIQNVSRASLSNHSLHELATGPA